MIFFFLCNFKVRNELKFSKTKNKKTVCGFSHREAKESLFFLENSIVVPIWKEGIFFFNFKERNNNIVILTIELAVVCEII